MWLTEQKLYPERPQHTAAELATDAKRLSSERENAHARAERRGGSSSPRHQAMPEVSERTYKTSLRDVLRLAKRSLAVLGDSEE